MSWRRLRELRGLALIFLLLVPVVGVLFITNSAMVLQARHLTLHWLGFDWLPAQIFVFNPLFSMVLIPLFSALIYPLTARVVRVTPLRKMGAGFAAALLGLMVLVWLQIQIDAGARPSVGWHVLVLGIFVAAELLVHLTALEFAYQEAPADLKSVALSFRPLAMALGNAFIALVSGAIPGELANAAPGVPYYLLFVVVLLVFAGLFAWAAASYRHCPATATSLPASP